jgi:SWIM zinc finger
VTYVPNRWTTEQVLALAPDTGSQRAAARLAGQAHWSGAGALGLVVWGLCAGSGQHPYQTAVDLSGPAYKCSCPSRKFPCKHALGLLLGWAAGAVPEAAAPADFAASWIADRASRAGRAERAAATAAAGGAGPAGLADEKAAARRAQQRQSRVDAGLAELETWLRDQVRAGLSGTGGYRHAERVAARMVDAQASGAAAVLRSTGGIAGSGDGWPGRLLAAYAGLHLLVRAHEQLAALPAGLAAAVRSHVGYPVARQEVLGRPAVRDRWLVLGVRDVLDGTIPVRRILLCGEETTRLALRLVFDPRGEFSGDLDAALVPGTALTADLHFYPGQPALRALIGQRHDEPSPAGPPRPSGDIGALLDDWARALAQDPWLTSWPALLAGTPGPDGPGWQLADESGQAVPLLTGESGAWPLVAISGGAPVVIAGEWSADGLRPLTAWHGNYAVPL